MEEAHKNAIIVRSIHSVFALFSRSLILQLVSFAASLIVFTKLSPHDVGIYTAVLAIQRIISFFTDFGLGAALIQKKENINQKDIKTCFTLQFLVTLLILLVVLFAKEQISIFFNLGQSGQWLLVALVVTIFLSSFKMIPSVLLERQIKFAKLAIPQVSEAVLFNILLIIFVLYGYAVTSFSIAFIVSSFIGVFVYYAISPWKIQLGIDGDSLQHLKFGTQFQLKNILATVKDDLLTTVLVKFISFTQIGYIGFAQRFAFLIYRYVVDNVTKVMFSSYARLQEDKKFLEKAVEKSLFFVSLITFPTISGIIVVGPYFIHYFSRWNKWEPAVLSLIFFCLNAIISSLSGILVNVLDATGRVKTTLKLMVLWTVLTWTLTPLLIYFFGFNGVAIASFIITLTIVQTIYLVKQNIPIRFFNSIYKPLIATTLMLFGTYFFARFFVTNMFMLITDILIGGCIYFVSIYFLAQDEIKEDIKQFKIRK